MEYFVDIDMTICFTPNLPNGDPDYDNSTPYHNDICRVNNLFDLGHTIIYWTSRGAKSCIDWRELTTKQLKQWGCKYHELRLNKPYYDILFDDKAYHLQNIDEIKQTLE